MVSVHICHYCRFQFEDTDRLVLKCLGMTHAPEEAFDIQLNLGVMGVDCIQERQVCVLV